MRYFVLLQLNQDSTGHIWPFGSCILELLIHFLEPPRASRALSLKSSPRGERKKKAKNILYCTFFKRQVMKTLDVLPWKLFTVAYKQQHLLSSQKTKACVHLKWDAVGKRASCHGVSGWWMLVVLEAMTGARKWERESKRVRQLGKRVRWAPAWARRASTGSAVKSSNTREQRCSRLHVPAVSEHREKEERKTAISRSPKLQRKVSAKRNHEDDKLLRLWPTRMEFTLHAYKQRGCKEIKHPTELWTRSLSFLK